jgi:chromatin remodeling complex protein RSC6
MSSESANTSLNTIDTEFKSIFENLSGFSKQTRALSDQVRALQKTCKLAEKQTKASKKKPQTPMSLSKELSTFLSVAPETQLTKAQVMKSISEYIKSNNLQVETNKRKFVPNKQLQKTFGMKAKAELTFVEINKHVSGHLSK